MKTLLKYTLLWATLHIPALLSACQPIEVNPADDRYKVQLWKEQLLVLLDHKLWSIKPDKRDKARMDFKSPVTDFTAMGDTLYVLTMEHKKMQLWQLHGNHKKAIELPAGIRAEDTELIGGDQLVLLSQRQAFIRQSQQWKEIGLPESTYKSIKHSKSAFYHKNGLYIAFEYGEWGGILIRCDLTADPIREQVIMQGNITDIHVDEQQQLWVAQGWEHYTAVTGKLSRLEQDKESTVIFCDTQDEAALCAFPAPRAIQSVCGNSAKNLYLLTTAGTAEVYRYEGSGEVSYLFHAPDDSRQIFSDRSGNIYIQQATHTLLKAVYKNNQYELYSIVL